MRRKTINAYEVFVWMITVCMTNFFGFYKYLPLGQQLFSTDYSFICVAIVAVLFLICIAIKRKYITVPQVFWELSIWLILLQFVEVIWTFFQYRQPIILTLKEAFFYIVPVICYLVFYQFGKDETDIVYFEDVLIKCSIASSAVAIIAFLCFSLGRINFLRLAVSSFDNYRNGTIRFEVGGIVVFFAFIVSLLRIIKKESGTLDKINIILSGFQFVVINKTRTVLIYMFIMFLVMILFEKQMKRYIRAILILLIIVGLLLAIFSLDSYSNSIVSYFNSDAGIAMRFKTIEFYIKQFCEKPVFGMGLISSSRDVLGWQLLYGQNGKFYRDDVGIVGLLNKYGLCGLLWVIAFFSYVWKRYKRSIHPQCSVLQFLCIYLLVSLINLSFLDPQRTMYLYLVFAIGSMIQRRTKRQDY